MPAFMTADYFSIAGGALGLVGSLILAFSLDQPLAMLRAHLGALDTTTQQLAGRGNVPIFTGLDEQHQRAATSAGRRVRLGGVLLALGFVSQALASALW